MAHTRSNAASIFTYSGCRATLCGQVICGCRSGIASANTAASRHGRSFRKRQKPGRSSSLKSSAVNSQSADENRAAAFAPDITQVH